MAILIPMAPRPEYRNPANKPIYAEIPKETKEMLEDIAYHLDVKTREALDRVIRYFYSNEGVKPRPSRKQGK